jgi:two-component system NtrC family sensor kinase
MKLHQKFSLGIIAVFIVLAVGMAIMSVKSINKNTIREAQNRVELYIRGAWEIHNNGIGKIRSSLEVLTHKQELIDLLNNSNNSTLLNEVKNDLEKVRKRLKMDILNLVDSQGKVILRTRFPYNNNDTLCDDPMINKVISTNIGSENNIILSSERLLIEGEGLVEHCIKFGGEPKGMLMGSALPIKVNNKTVGIIQMGRLLNGATETVDRIRDAVFENKKYEGIPIGTATIFMGDLRISTNVLDSQDNRAIGTRVSEEVAEHVLKKGLSWTGRALVVNSWYLSQYDPIRDPDGKIIGMLYVGELEKKYLDMRTQTVITFLSIIFAGMIFAFIVFFLITKSILGPIRNLSYATKKLSRGDLNSRVDVRPGDEIGELSASFNHMAEQLKIQRQEIQHNQQILEDINKELKAINRNYMEMLGFVSHELKNPLASAIMSLHTVKDGYLGELNASQIKSLESVGHNLDYFKDMIKNYLDLSRLEKGELVLKKRDISLYEEGISPVIEGLEHELVEKKIKVDNKIPDDMIINVDRDLIRIVYDNLLSNAIKYGKEGGKIVLDTEESKEKIVLSVFNEGKGIPKDKMSMLFRKFSRIENPEYKDKKGTGLGLFICKEIIEKQGGFIRAESEEGKWARFIFTLPK